MLLTLERYEDTVSTFLRISKHYGISPYSSMEAELIIIYDPIESYFGMMHDHDTIAINFAKHRRWNHVVSTLIHEYVHYLQPRNWYDRHFQNGHTYKSHPYELEADIIMHRDLHLFI